MIFFLFKDQSKTDSEVQVFQSLKDSLFATIVIFFHAISKQLNRWKKMEKSIRFRKIMVVGG